MHPVVPSFESVYPAPPTSPKFMHPDPSEFARHRIAPDGTELLKYQILVDRIKLEEAKMIADANLNSPTPLYQYYVSTLWQVRTAISVSLEEDS